MDKSLVNCFSEENEAEIERDFLETPSTDFIVFSDIRDEEVSFYSPDDILIGRTDNILTYHDVLLQIMRHFYENDGKMLNEPSGYYMLFHGIKVHINKNGSHEHIDGLFDIIDKQLSELCQI